MTSFDPSVVVEALPDLMRGTALTIEITALGLVGGFVLGVAAGIARAGRMRLAGLIASVYVALIRGTPLVVQVMFIYFALPLAVGLRIDPMSAAVGAIAINAGAYIAEVVRGAIVSIDRGLIEAGLALGVLPRRVLATVVWPIAFRRMLPALGNQFIISLKDTSILIVIGVGELTRRGQEIIATNFRAMEIWSAVAIIYLILTATLALVLRLVEKRMRIL
mgnify:CR=1 FL=1